MHLELIYIENLAASQNSMDSIATSLFDFTRIL